LYAWPAVGLILWFVAQDQHTHRAHVNKDPQAGRARKVSSPRNLQPHACKSFHVFSILSTHTFAIPRYPGVVFYSEIFQITQPIMRAAAVVAGHGFVVLVPEIYHDIVQEGWVGQYDTAGADQGNALKITKTIESYDSGAWPTFHTGRVHRLGVVVTQYARIALFFRVLKLYFCHLFCAVPLCVSNLDIRAETGVGAVDLCTYIFGHACPKYFFCYYSKCSALYVYIHAHAHAQIPK
jgi:hypothetical protein